MHKDLLNHDDAKRPDVMTGVTDDDTLRSGYRLIELRTEDFWGRIMLSAAWPQAASSSHASNCQPILISKGLLQEQCERLPALCAHTHCLAIDTPASWHGAGQL